MKLTESKCMDVKDHPRLMANGGSPAGVEAGWAQGEDDRGDGRVDSGLGQGPRDGPGTPEDLARTQEELADVYITLTTVVSLYFNDDNAFQRS